MSNRIKIQKDGSIKLPFLLDASDLSYLEFPDEARNPQVLDSIKVAIKEKAESYKPKTLYHDISTTRKVGRAVATAALTDVVLTGMNYSSGAIDYTYLPTIMSYWALVGTGVALSREYVSWYNSTTYEKLNKFADNLSIDSLQERKGRFGGKKIVAVST